MSQLLEKYLPYFLVAFFVFRSFKDPIYLLGIPFLLFLRYCIFFNKIQIFNAPGSQTPDIRLFAWLIFVWGSFFAMKSFIKKKSAENKGFNRLDAVIVGLIILSVIGLITVEREYILKDLVSNEFFTIIALFVGFFIVKNIISNTETISLKDFLYTIVVVNSIASVLYFVHQGLHFDIYIDNGGEEYSSELFQGVIITRTFWFMPVLWYFSIAYLLIFFKERPTLNIGLIVINFLAIFISYNKSSLLDGLMILFLYFIMKSIKDKNYASLVKYFFGIGVGLAIFYIAVSKFMPASTNYFIDRISELKQNPSDEESNSLVVRFHNTGDIFSRMEPGKRVLGMGPVTESQLPLVEDMKAITADMAWTGVVFRWGYVGLALFVLLFLFGLFESYKLFMKNDGILSRLGLLFFLTIISQIMESFASWTFMSPDRFAMGLWYFGILSALINRAKKTEMKAETLNVKYAEVS